MLRKKRHTFATITAITLTAAITAAPIAALAAPPSTVGEEGIHTIVTRNETMRSDSHDFITQQHVMRQGWNQDFYAGVTDGDTYKESEFYIYRYFEDETTPVTGWNTAQEFTASSGSDITIRRPLGLATDSASQTLYTIHRSDHSSNAGPHTIVQWDENGNYLDHWSFEFGFSAAVHAMQFDPVTKTLVINVDSPFATESSGLYEFDFSTGEATLVSVQNKESAFEGKTQLDITEAGLIYFQNGARELGIYDRATGTAKYAPYNASITGMTAQGELVVSTLDYEVFRADPETGAYLETIIPTSITQYDRAFATIRGTDDRYYASSAERPEGHSWDNGGVYAVELDTYELSLPHIAYPVEPTALNVCLPTNTSISPKLTGQPLPTWFERTDSSLPEGLELDQATGVISGTVSPDADLGSYSIDVLPYNGVTPVNSTQEVGTARLEVVKTPVEFSEVSAPEITGEATVGGTLTASVQEWTPSQSLSYQWLRDGVAIDNATSDSYVLQEADQGSHISVSATSSGDCLIETTSFSTAITVPAPPEPETPTGPSTPTDPTVPTGPGTSAGPDASNNPAPSAPTTSPGKASSGNTDLASPETTLPTTGPSLDLPGWAAVSLALAIGGLAVLFMRRPPKK